MIILLGESGSGKSTLEKMLCDKYVPTKIISYTTRSMRPNETNGIDYHFIKDEEFLRKRDDDEFAEYYTTENGWRYGIDKNDCKIGAVCVVTPEGLQQLKEHNGLNITSIYIKSSKDTRKERLWQRGDCHLEMMRRFQTDAEDFENISEIVDYTIENEGSIDETFNTLVELLKNLEVI